MNEDTKRSAVIIRILKIITKHTDAEHSITQLDICQIYKNMYENLINNSLWVPATRKKTRDPLLFTTRNNCVMRYVRRYSLFFFAASHRELLKTY